MLENSEITLFRYDGAEDEYKNLGTVRAWVHKKDRLHKSDGGEVRRESFSVRIAADRVSEILNGDRIFFGKTAGGCDNIEFGTVSRVKDNRFGTEPHWTVEADYRYI